MDLGEGLVDSSPQTSQDKDFQCPIIIFITTAIFDIDAGAVVAIAATMTIPIPEVLETLGEIRRILIRIPDDRDTQPLVMASSRGFDGVQITDHGIGELCIIFSDQILIRPSSRSNF